MSDSHDKNLDGLLKDWAQSRDASAGHLAALQQQVETRMAAEPLVTMRSVPVTSVSARRGWWLAAASLGIAAALFVALSGWWEFLRSNGSRGEIAETLEQPQIPTAPALADRIQLLTEYQEVFGPDFAWLVEQPNHADVGLRPSDSRRAVDPRDYFAVRLMLFARPANGKKWKAVQSLNVVAGREEFVEVSSERESGAALTMWAYPLDEKMISIDLRYEPSKFADHSNLPDGMLIESSGVQALGEAAAIQSFERGGIEYRLYQSADLLGEKSPDEHQEGLGHQKG
jgi:hypothetical protein